MTGALGLIEVIGYPPAIEAADAALKAANVQLGGIVKVDGGIMTIQILGDVGAVKAAVDAAGMAAARVGTVRATHVIPRVDQALLGTVVKIKEAPIKREIEAPIIEEVSNETAEEILETAPEMLEETIPLDHVAVQDGVMAEPMQDVDAEVVRVDHQNLKNMSNKELKGLIASLSIKVTEKKLKSAKKEDLIKILNDFYKVREGEA